ncbi:hypothetical protein K503DRAFT_698338 [Rhizopogon vinicolor AM-OR11-026]|uniref:Uncharacterized protein n=1 Tax=Rhizopogon vinicolor AM-OR11-026 TaxID=1314800 RepID=A0A1B7MPW7_9AGAM|nr:hypothetical protein K503DRAFT_698338 [Rhizopogon vinicolor AM-OR11-026]
MLIAACLLFLLGTMRVIVDANHVWQGFISSTDVDMFFEDVTKNTFKNALYELETLVGDAILIYRCYVVWGRIQVIIIPIIGWLAVATTGTHAVWSISQLSPTNANIIFQEETGQWIISFYSVALVTNLISTSILALRLWLLHRRSTGIQMTRSHVYPILLIIIECGALYSMSLVTMLATYLVASNSAYIVIDMIGQIIPITFCLIITRTAMLRFNDRRVQWRFTSTGTSDYLPTARPVKVRIDGLTVTDTEVGKVSETPSGRIDAIERGKWKHLVDQENGTHLYFRVQADVNTDNFDGKFDILFDFSREISMDYLVI